MEDIDVDIEGEFNLASTFESQPDALVALPSHPWDLPQEWCIENCEDEESKATIHKMLHEENYYIHGKKTPLSPTHAAVAEQEVTKRIPWTMEEKNTVIAAMEQYGKKWTKIAELVPSRTASQIANFGYKHLKRLEADLAVTIPHTMLENGPVVDPLVATTTGQPTVPTAKKTPLKKLTKKLGRKPNLTPEKRIKFAHQNEKATEVVRLQRDTDSDTDAEIDIEDDADMFNPDRFLHKQSSNINSVASFLTDLTSDANSAKADKKLKIESSEFNDNFGASGSHLNGVKVEDVKTEVNSDGVKVEECVEGVKVENGDEDDSPLKSEHPGEFPVLNSNGKRVYLKNPISELLLDNSTISKQEEEMFSEFFDQRPGQKNPKRYLKIRNTILDAWNRQKPRYLNKTAIRGTLKNCGDVNCIGRVHSYMEQIGAINFGCVDAQYVTGKIAVVNRSKWVKQEGCVKDSDQRNSRKRRVRDATGSWVDEKELEGQTFDHTTNSVTQITKDSVPKPLANLRMAKYDPFKLIPCSQFNSEHPATFSVEVCSGALAIMDTHAHLSMSEVIGLLGGRYEADTHILYIDQAEPCESVSTAVQCEMDPVSQIEASEKLCDAGLQVIGWYHSHPTFAPNPSVRDLETQGKFQEWFTRDNAPFVGIIVNPYNNKQMSSSTKCLSVEMGKTSVIPYEYDYNLSEFDSTKWPTIEKQVLKLIEKYLHAKHRVNMKSIYLTHNGNVNCYTKMIRSISQYFLCENDRQQVIEQLTSLLNMAQT